MATGEPAPQRDVSRSNAKSPKCVLPPEKVFSIQVGTKLFRLSGASISSDAPSYFSQFFEDQLSQRGNGLNTRTLYIDRDPYTFQIIAQHLQGYHVKPTDGAQFVKLFADAQFYSLPRLVSQLFESEIFIQIGDSHFQIPRDIFSSPGDSPNFFTVGFAVFFSTPTEVFPGLDRDSLLRPPAIIPPNVPHRSGEVFAELAHALRGYPLHIRDEEHRAQLLRDCRYFHLRGLEQKLIPHSISFNPVRQRSEIVIRLEDVRQSGVQFASDNPAVPSGGWVVYARPFVDDKTSDLIVEIGNEMTAIDLDAMCADFFDLTKARISSLLQVVAKKTNLPFTTPLGSSTRRSDETESVSSNASVGETRVKVRIHDEADITVDGEPTPPSSIIPSSTPPDVAPQPPAKRKRSELEEPESFIVRTGQWRLRVQPRSAGEDFEMVFVAVKLDAYTKQRMRNKSRRFLG